MQVFLVRFGWQSLQMPLANISSYAVVRNIWTAKSVCGAFRLSNPFTGWGSDWRSNNGLPTSVCERCLDALIRSLKRPGLRDGFQASQPCEVCERPVYDLKGSKVTRVVCSPGCRGVIDSERRMERRNSRRSRAVSQV
jgi:hypothetical protein